MEVDPCVPVQAGAAGHGRPALFVDRDGTLIEDVGYPADPQDVRLLPGSAAALAALQRHGFALVVVSNQSGIGRGLVSTEQAARVHHRFTDLLAEQGVTLDAAYYCPHHPEEGCPCRKPSPQALLRAAAELDLCLSRSFMVGDKASDVEAGKHAGCRSVLFGSRPDLAGCGVAPDRFASTWEQVLQYLLPQSMEMS